MTDPDIIDAKTSTERDLVAFENELRNTCSGTSTARAPSKIKRDQPSQCQGSAQCVVITTKPAGLCDAGRSGRLNNFAKLKNIEGCPSEATMSFKNPNGRSGTWEIDNKRGLTVEWSCGGPLEVTGISFPCPKR